MINYFLGLLQLVSLLVIVFLEFRKKSASVFLWATLLLVFSIPHFLEILFGQSDYSSKTMTISSLFVILFNSIYLLTRKMLTKVTVNKHKSISNIGFDINHKRIYKQKMIERTLLIIFVTITLYSVVSFINYAGGIKNVSWGLGMQMSVEREYFNTGQVFIVLYFLLSGLLLYFLLKKRFFAFILASSMVAVRVLIGGNRIYILPIPVSIIAYFVFKIKKLRMKEIIFFAILGFFVIFLVYGLRVFRHYGTIETFINEFNLNEFINRIFVYLKTDNGELGLKDSLYFFIDNNNNFEDFNKGHTYIRMLLVFIPTRLSFGLNPSDFAITMGSAVGMSVGGSMHPTLFGDVYANFGFAGIFLGIFWSIFVMVSDKIITRKDPMGTSILFSLYSIMFIIIGRGSVYNGFVWLSYGVLLYIIFEKIIIKPKRYKFQTEIF